MYSLVMYLLLQFFRTDALYLYTVLYWHASLICTLTISLPRHYLKMKRKRGVGVIVVDDDAGATLDYIDFILCI